MNVFPFTIYSFFNIINLSNHTNNWSGLYRVISFSSFFDSLNKETFPLLQEYLKLYRLQKFHYKEGSCQYPISVSGEEKFKLFVIATGSAPTQLTFLADSATATIVPLKDQDIPIYYYNQLRQQHQNTLFLFFI